MTESSNTKRKIFPNFSISIFSIFFLQLISKTEIMLYDRTTDTLPDRRILHIGQQLTVYIEFSADLQRQKWTENAVSQPVGVRRRHCLLMMNGLPLCGTLPAASATARFHDRLPSVRIRFYDPVVSVTYRYTDGPTPALC